jgi:beta-phosphoglucomutase-like phosphatase (HAD superfamily)
VVEDSIQGVKAGKAADCIVVALEGSIEKEFLVDADYIISSLRDIENII